MDARVVAYNRRSLWWAEIALIIGMLVFVGLVELIIALTDPQLSGPALLLTGVILALVPAVLWLYFFYRQDRSEPEPTHFVLAVAVLSALLAAAIGQPILDGFFNLSEWIGRDALTEILGSILITGFLQMFLIYAAVRYSVYLSNEFDHRIDGVVYGTASGVGYATMLNIWAVLDSGGLDLSVGVIRIVVTALVYAALGGLLGYFIARTKFDDEPVWWMPAGLTLAAVLTGLFAWLRGEITQTTITITAQGTSGGYNPWPALIAGIVMAAVLLAIIYYLVQRANRLTLAGADADTA